MNKKVYRTAIYARLSRDDGDKAESNSYRYKVDVAVPAIGEDCSSWSKWDGSADIAAANGSTLVVAEVDSNGMAVKAGSVAVTAKA